MSQLSLLTQDNTKLLEQLKSGFKRIISWKNIIQEYQYRPKNQYLDYLIDPIFQRVNNILVLLFEDNAIKTGIRRMFCSKSQNITLQCHD